MCKQAAWPGRSGEMADTLQGRVVLATAVGRVGRGRGVKEVGEKERRGRERGRRKDEREMVRDGGRNTSFSSEKHFRLTKTFPRPLSSSRCCKHQTHSAKEQTGVKKAQEVVPLRRHSKPVFLPWLPLQRRGRKTGGAGQAGVGTSFRLEVGDAMHDHVVQKQGLVVHFDGAGEQAAEVMHVPGAGTGAASARRSEPEPSHPIVSFPP